MFPHRRTRKRAEEDFPEMGELALGPRRVPHRRPVRGHARWQEPHQAARGAVGRETGKYISHTLSVPINLQKHYLSDYLNP